MDEIINIMGGVVYKISEFFSFIAPGYIIIITAIFVSLFPYALFKIITKGVRNHA